MITKFLKENTYAAYILTIIRIYVGYQWLTAGWGKITGGFDAKGFLLGAAAKAAGDHPAVQPWWADFLNGVAIPNAKLFSYMVAYGEFLVGLGLILGCLTTIAALAGMVMNFAFLLSGTTSTNPQMVILEIFIVVAAANAGAIGVDRYLLPYLKNKLFKGRKTDKTGKGGKLTPLAH